MVKNDEDWESYEQMMEEAREALEQAEEEMAIQRANDEYDQFQAVEEARQEALQAQHDEEAYYEEMMAEAERDALQAQYDDVKITPLDMMTETMVDDTEERDVATPGEELLAMGHSPQDVVAMGYPLDARYFSNSKHKPTRRFQPPSPKDPDHEE
jgi:hypothetical protein